MHGTSAPKTPTSEERGDGHLSHRSGRPSLSILGLSIVSGLNVASLAFIAYHLTAHPREPKVSANHPETSEASDADTLRPEQPSLATTQGVLGNVDLAPTSRHVISIASGFDLIEAEPVDRHENASIASTRPDGSAGIASANADQASGHWVQLGALSKEAVAQSYWSVLKLRHDALLREREPRYFGPTEVGGGLYHIRLGPMEDDAAARLCERLEAEGADCFCVSPEDSVWSVKPTRRGRQNTDPEN